MKNLQSVPSCKNCTSITNFIFRQLPSSELDNLSFEKTCGFYKRGNVIFHEGIRPNGFYCVNSGIVKIYKTGIDGKEQIIRFSKKGDIFGYRPILSNEPACASAKVIDDAVLCFISADKLVLLLKRNPEFSLEMMHLACKELGEANRYIADIAQKSVRERLAEVLVKLKHTFDLNENDELQVSLSREELANIVGTATESVIRLLSEFKTDKLIALNGRKIKFLNIEALQKIGNVDKYM